jgi:hypothetical protein
MILKKDFFRRDFEPVYDRLKKYLDDEAELVGMAANRLNLMAVEPEAQGDLRMLVEELANSQRRLAALTAGEESSEPKKKSRWRRR